MSQLVGLNPLVWLPCPLQGQPESHHFAADLDGAVLLRHSRQRANGLLFLKRREILFFSDRPQLLPDHDLSEGRRISTRPRCHGGPLSEQLLECRPAAERTARKKTTGAELATEATCLCCLACLPAKLLVCLLACLSPCLPACLFPCLPACLPGCQSVCLSACLLACRPACLLRGWLQDWHNPCGAPSTVTSSGSMLRKSLFWVRLKVAGGAALPARPSKNRSETM